MNKNIFMGILVFYYLCGVNNARAGDVPAYFYISSIKPYSVNVYYSRNEATGEIQFGGLNNAGGVDGSNAAAVIQASINALTTGRDWMEEIVLNGRFDLDNTIILPSYTKLSINGQLNQNAVIDPMIDIMENSQLVEINGGVILGNKSSYWGSGLRIRRAAYGATGDPNIVLRNVYVRNFMGTCVRDDGRKTMIIGGSALGCNQYGYHVSGTDGTYIGVLAKHNGNDSFYVSGNWHNFIKCAADHGFVGATGSGFNITGSNNVLFGGYAEWREGNGIRITGNNNQIRSMMIISNNSNGISIINGAYNQIVGNRIYDSRKPPIQDWAIIESGTADNNIIRENIVLDNKRTIQVSGSKTIIRDNQGFLTETGGEATISNGNTLVVIRHGLGRIPYSKDINVHPTGPLNRASSWWVDNITAEDFTIHLNADPGADVGFAWSHAIH